MNNTNVSLVVEGGGFRAIFAAAAIDVLTNHHILPNHIVSVSAGAAYSLSMLTHQADRNQKTIQFINHPDYCGMKFFLRDGNFFNWRFVYKTIPTELLPLDYAKIGEYQGTFEVCATNCITGEADFLSMVTSNPDELGRKLAATSALPFLSKPIEIAGTPYLDGGISNSIPIDRIGNKPAIVILTQPLGYVKKTVKPRWLITRKYRNYPKLAQAILNRHTMYNNTLARIEMLERQDQIFVIRPKQKVPIGRLENNPPHVSAVYTSSYHEVENDYQALQAWLERHQISV